MNRELPDFLALGPFEVRRSGQPVDLGSPKQRAVLGVLLAEAPRAVPVERLVDEIWPDSPPRDPLRSLQVYVSALRQALGPCADLLATVGRAYRLDVPADRVDVARFEDQAAEATRLLARGEHHGAAQVAGSALELWRGTAWQDLRHLPGIEPAAVRLDELRLDVVATRVGARLAVGEHRELVAELDDLVARHPFREDLRAQLMVALHRSGRQAEALEVYAAGREHKAEEIGLDPGAALQELHAAILGDDPTLAVEDAELRARRHLPAQATGLVGRRDDVDDVVHLLRDTGCRLLTLTGAGGIGKTRVGLQAAHELAAVFPDGVWFIGLADLHDHRLVPQAVADAIGVEEVAGDFSAPLRAWVRGRRALLLLDNFEQVDEAAPLAADLLAAGNGTRLLVTSRTRLRLYGEQVRALDPLEADEAVRLFVERARSADRRFDATATRDIRRVCEALDRLPLALELVAARADEVPLATILSQLESRLDLASDGPRDRSPRQQTLRNAIGWSVDLLPAPEAEAFGRLGVFVGGFDPDAAQQVANAGPDVLAALVRASLVVVGTDGRHRLLETVREYAIELAGDQLNRSRDAHAAWFLQLAEQAVDGMRGPGQADWLVRLQLERGNVRAALQRLFETAGRDQPAGDRLMRLAASMALFWYRTSPGSEDVDWLPRAIATAPDAEPSLRGRALHGLAICRGEQGRAEEALEHSRASYHLLREGDELAWTARALNTLAGITRDLGRSEEAAPLMDESIALRRHLGDPTLPLTIALGNRAMVALDVGDLDRARACLEECLALEGLDELEFAWAQVALADVALEAGEVDEAVRLLRMAAPKVHRDALRFRALECLDTFAALAVRRGRLTDAALLVAAADRAMAEEGAVQVPADAILRERRIGRFLATLEPAERAEAEETGRTHDLHDAIELAIDRLL